jgi:hypothetical protein
MYIRRRISPPADVNLLQVELLVLLLLSAIPVHNLIAVNLLGSEVRR